MEHYFLRFHGLCHSLWNKCMRSFCRLWDNCDLKNGKPSWVCDWSLLKCLVPWGWWSEKAGLEKRTKTCYSGHWSWECNACRYTRLGTRRDRHAFSHWPTSGQDTGRPASSRWRARITRPRKQLCPHNSSQQCCMDAICKKMPKRREALWNIYSPQITQPSVHVEFFLPAYWIPWSI